MKQTLITRSEANDIAVTAAVIAAHHLDSDECSIEDYDKVVDLATSFVSQYSHVEEWAEFVDTDKLAKKLGAADWEDFVALWSEKYWDTWKSL